MKILLVVHTFLPKYVGGTEVCTYELAKKFTSLGHEVIIFCTDPLSHNIQLQVIESYYCGIKIYTVPKNISKYKNFSNTYLENRVISPFNNLLTEFKPNIIHYHHFMHLSIEMADLGKKLKIPQILTLHDFWFQCLTHQRITTRGKLCKSFSEEKCSRCLSDIMNSGPLTNTTFSFKDYMENDHKCKYLLDIAKKVYQRNFGKLIYSTNKNQLVKMVDVRNKYMKSLFTKLDLLIFPTKFLYDQFSNWKINSDKSILSSDGINTEIFKKTKHILGKTIRFAFIGSIIPTKGLDMILKAWPKIKKGGYNLKIYGSLQTDKKYSSTIVHLAKNLQNITFCGTFEPGKVADIFSDIDVLIVPSRWFENAPLVLRNAMHTKTPVIAVNLGSIPELVTPGKNGLLYENEDLDGLIRQMNYFITHPKAISQMKDNFPPQKSIGTNATELLSYYRKLTKDETKR